MELYQLRSFAAVAESGHLTRAADRLHISQPALSAQIKALEDELGVALFERLPSGMELTPAGRSLLPEAQKVVAAAQVLRSHASAFKGEVAGRVRVGTVSDPEFIRVGDLLAQAVDVVPAARNRAAQRGFRCGLREGARRRARREFLLRQPHPSDRRRHSACALLPIASSRRWRGASASTNAPWDEIVAMPWIMTPPISTHSALAGELFREHGVSPARRVEADHEAVISSLVMAGLGVSLMREDLAIAAAAAGDESCCGATSGC